MKKLIAQGYSDVSFQEALRCAERLVRSALGENTPFTVADSSVREEDGQWWYLLTVTYAE